MKALGLTLLLLTTFVIASLHAAVAPPLTELVGHEAATAGEFIDKSKFGMHQLILEGTAFDRGYNAGRLTQKLMAMEEHDLYEQLERMVPNHFFLKTMTVVLANYFRGIARYFEPWALEEMYGVSHWAPHEYDFLGDGYTRQIAYHGLHEVGQMMVDSGIPFACTAVIAKHHDNWIVGRNFDFEGGDVFDREKIVKWVFPSEGQPFVSVIWAGMVGAVTGVNANGLYISLNAAGSRDYARIGTPSTLVIAKALQFAHSVDEAIEIFKSEQMFITDIFVVVDSQTKRAFRIEKSPARTVVTELRDDSIVTNHLQSPEFEGDSLNKWRKEELTSSYRQARGEQLLKKLKISQAKSVDEARLQVLKILRDKGEGIQLNNRRAIDALIAAHSVVFDSENQILFVSQGPAVSGKFTGFDLKKSFAAKEPVQAGELPADPTVSLATWESVRNSEKRVWKTRASLSHKDCKEAKDFLAGVTFLKTSPYHHLLGDYDHQCEHNLDSAKAEWQKALDLKPAYARDERAIKESLDHAN